MDGAAAPAGFIEFSHQNAIVVCVARLADDLRAALDYDTIYDYARDHQACEPFMGRGPSFITQLGPGGERVVVRHNRHGGMFAGFTGDRFLAPTRAPFELTASLRLQRLGIPTPDILGYATYPAGPGFRRADVFSREVPNAIDLSDSIASDDAHERTSGLAEGARLLAAVSKAGVRHHDFNVKNVLLRPLDGGHAGMLLDVDVVTFDNTPADALTKNLERILRSARKWQTRYRAPLSDAELDEFVRLARAAFAVPRSTAS